MIRNATREDSKAIAAIYNHYVLNTVVTFEETPVSAEEMQQRIADTQEKYHWLVYEENNEVIGYAYSHAWRVRAAYRYSSELSVYLAPGHTGRGIGKKLYQAVIDEARKLKLHAVIGGVALPNEASVKLHEKLGFKKVGEFEEVGIKFGKWVNVAYWELILT